MTLAVVAFISLAIVLAGYALRALTRSGAVAAFFVGIACLGYGGYAVAASLVAFFVSGSTLSRLSARSSAAPAGAKGATRDAVQVLANGGAAALGALIAGLVYEAGPSAARWLAASVCAIASAAADTWATEIGSHSTTPPRSIVTWQPVSIGASGGVTTLGTLASLAGAAFIGAAYAAFLPAHRFGIVVGVMSIGFIGALLDSILGASLQGVWHCDACSMDCETRVHACGARTRLVRGAPWLDNDGVNAISTIAGVVLGYFAFPLFAR